ncbi:sporulation protein YunB [Litchfieldia salsa]|uniref:Sporulation protein YunB n=1 Tax=Litchfieldia salsa TaxID=930152 RepID=A0A1H0WQ29_9BACI|nr:sporulation protein YunB [Litchfieldia salsa]SDP92773.1 sporulation protein YunB [Litchfieldia salsa]
MPKFRGRGIPRKGPLPFRYVFLLTFVFFMFSTAVGLVIVNKGIEPTLIKYAQNETSRIATVVIKNAITKQMTEESLSDEDIILTQTDSDGKITSVTFNSKLINEILAKTTNNVDKYLKFVNKGDVAALDLPEVDLQTDEKSPGFIYEIPLGQATNNAILGNLGPKIPIRFHMIGDVMTDYSSKISDHGINNTYIEVLVHIEVRIQVIIPFATEEVIVPTNVPIAGPIFIPGEVPLYYNDGGDGSAPSIELPGN